VETTSESMPGEIEGSASLSLALLVPGPLAQLTGGYLFARRVVEGLRALGRAVTVIELEGRFPDADNAARAAASAALRDLPAGSIAVIDGLALPGFTECLPCETQRLRLVGFIHHPLSRETGLDASIAQRYAEIEARLWPLLRGAICPSAHTARALIDAGLPARRVAVASPGTDKAVMIPKRGKRNALHLVTVGTVTPRKGHLLLVEALAGLREIDWHLTCIGSLERDRAAAEALRRSIAEKALGERITLAGECAPARVSNAYGDADVFVLPSYEEGYGMVCAEALVHGLPLVTTTAGAIAETVPASAALFVPPGDAIALRDALQRMMTDATLRVRLASGAAAAARTLPDWSAAVRVWAAALDRLAA
jgi:glycosyltransferase involved in cell wall biosynthesis